MNFSVHLAPKSSNRKTGPIKVTTMPRRVCPVECIHRGSSCYFDNGRPAIFWTHVDRADEAPDNAHRNVNKLGHVSTTRTLPWGEFCDLIESDAFTPGELARFAQGGDMPGDGRRLDRDAVLAFARASKRKGVRWIVYTHYVWGSPRAADLLHNVAVIREAMREGLVINVSCDTFEQVDTVRALGLLAAVTAPSDYSQRTSRTPGGNLLSQCPATYRETGPGSSCDTCGGCAIGAEGRATWVFPAHGARKRQVDQRLALFRQEGVTH